MTAMYQAGVWESVSTGFGIGSSAVAVIGALWGFAFLLRRWWDRTVGRRRAQSAILDQIIGTSARAFVESLLGVPQFIRRDDDYEQRFYRLPGAWVMVEPVDSAVRALTITITDPDMYYETKGLTFGVVDLRLGKDTFASTRGWSDAQFAIGARHATYVQRYDANNPSGFQEYWLAHNVTGAGDIGGDRFASGVCAKGYKPDHLNADGTFGSPPDLAAITANSLTVMSPEGTQEHSAHIDTWAAHGPHVEHLRLLWTERGRIYR